MASAAISPLSLLGRKLLECELSMIGITISTIMLSSEEATDLERSPLCRN